MMDQKRAFRNGALAMQARIVTFLVTKNLFELAPQILRMEPPPYSEPEMVTLQGEENQT